MQEIIASVDHIKFDLEIAVEQQLGAQPLPFPGMDKSGAAVCEFFLKAACGKGGMCPFRHISGEKTVVCKHWLRGLCKKGDQCEFLHEYDMTKMPECYFYSKFGECSNKECPFLHIDPESKIKDCPWYDRGFCKHGPLCRHRHTRRVICVNYLVGFCPEGPSCKFMHPRFELPMGTTEQPPLPQQTQPPAKVPCPGPAVLPGLAAPWPQNAQRPRLSAGPAGDPAGDRGRRRERRGVTLVPAETPGSGAVCTFSGLEGCLLEPDAHRASLPFLPGECRAAWAPHVCRSCLRFRPFSLQTGLPAGQERKCG
uniref:Cleavage and polyadenylation specificity factor subunit 4 n=1 Tax=Phocoena sinus TaxID=42100 RepID=A0A8C9C834_PHOSS